MITLKQAQEIAEAYRLFEQAKEMKRIAAGSYGGFILAECVGREKVTLSPRLFRMVVDQAMAIGLAGLGNAGVGFGADPQETPIE